MNVNMDGECGRRDEREEDKSRADDWAKGDFCSCEEFVIVSTWQLVEVMHANHLLNGCIMN